MDPRPLTPPPLRLLERPVRLSRPATRPQPQPPARWWERMLGLDAGPATRG